MKARWASAAGPAQGQRMAGRGTRCAGGVLLRGAVGLAVMLGTVGMEAGAAGQTSSRGVRGDERESFAPEAYAARMIARVALMDLRLQAEPTPEDYAIAAAVLGTAEAINPGDPDVLRRRIAALWNAEDEAGAIEATRRLVKLDPKDTVAQLRLISALIGRAQTVEERLAQYDRYLGKDGAALDPSVRSRLAVDAALLCKDRGDEAGFVERVKQATALDGTNKEAALLALTYFTSAGGDAVARMELLLNLIYADPLDPNVFLAAARDAAASGAFKGATRLYNCGLKVYSAGGSGIGLDTELERLMLQWHQAGPDPVRETLNQRLRDERAQAARAAAAARAALVPDSQITKPEDVRLPAQFEIIRAYSSYVMGDTRGLDESLTDFVASVDSMVKEAKDPAARPQEITEEAALKLLDRIRVEALLVRAVCGRLLETVEPGLKELEQAGLEATDQRPAAARAWVKFHNGEVEAALAEFERLAGGARADGSAELAAQLGKGEALRALKRSGEANDAYREMLRRAPLKAITGVAISRLGGEGKALTPETAGVERLIAAMPGWIDEAAVKPRVFQTTVVTPLATMLRNFERPRLRFAVTNTGTIPLALGSNRTISTSFLISPALEIASQSMAAQVRAEIVELDRRLRLMPGETLEAEVYPEMGYTGWLADTLMLMPMRSRYRVAQGFVAGEDGSIYAGPGGTTTETPPVTRPALQELQSEGKDLAARVRGAKDMSLTALALSARALVLGGGLVNRGLELADRKAFADAFAEVYPKATPAERGMLLAILPHAGQAAEFGAFDDVTAGEQDAGLLVLALVTRAGRAESPIFAAAEKHADHAVRRVAELAKERLGGLTMTYAKATAELTSLAPPGGEGETAAVPRLLEPEPAAGGVSK